MDGISSRKLTWGICIVGIAIAIISFFFLPEIIPVHFAGNGVADDFGNKIEIFLMPILLLTVTILSDVKVAVCPECGHTEMYLEDLTKLK